MRPSASLSWRLRSNLRAEPLVQRWVPACASLSLRRTGGICRKTWVVLGSFFHHVRAGSTSCVLFDLLLGRPGEVTNYTVRSRVAATIKHNTAFPFHHGSPRRPQASLSRSSRTRSSVSKAASVTARDSRKSMDWVEGRLVAPSCRILVCNHLSDVCTLAWDQLKTKGRYTQYKFPPISAGMHLYMHGPCRATQWRPTSCRHHALTGASQR